MLTENLLEFARKIPRATVVEIGVAQGETAEKFLQCETVEHYYGIDPFELYPDAPSERFEHGYLDLKMVKVPKSHGSMQGLKQVCLQRLKPYEGRYTLIERFSHEAVDCVPGLIDILYIDGNHQYEYVMADMEAWVPKVRPGGLVIGDDYLFSGGPETEGFGGKIACEVDRACQDYCRQADLKFDVIDGNFVIEIPK